MDTETDDPTLILIGAGIGAGTAAATGGDVGKGAIFGAAAGGIGGAAAGGAGGLTQASIGGVAVAPATFGAIGGGVLGGLSARKKKAPNVLDPIQSVATALPVTAVLSEAAKRKRRRDASFLTRDLQQPTLGTPALLGVA